MTVYFSQCWFKNNCWKINQLDLDLPPLLLGAFFELKTLIFIRLYCALGKFIPPQKTTFQAFRKYREKSTYYQAKNNNEHP